MVRPLLALCLVLPACSKPADGSSDTPTPAATKTDADQTPSKGKAAPADGKEDDAAQAHTEEPPPAAGATVGEPAPDFTLTDLDGNTHSLSSHKGKIVVLEWFNPQCPFVEFAHTKGPLVDMAKAETGQGVVWLAINSGAPGKQGHGPEANRAGVQTYGIEHPVLLDEDGTVGRTYGAIKTPHMFVVDAEGTLVYAGGIDNAPFGEVDGEAEKQNFVQGALADLRAGKPVTTPSAKPYGCSVKYAKT